MKRAVAYITPETCPAGDYNCKGCVYENGISVRNWKVECLPLSFSYDRGEEITEQEVSWISPEDCPRGNKNCKGCVYAFKVDAVCGTVACSAEEELEG